MPTVTLRNVDPAQQTIELDSGRRVNYLEQDTGSTTSPVNAQAIAAGKLRDVGAAPAPTPAPQERLVRAILIDPQADQTLAYDPGVGSDGAFRNRTSLLGGSGDGVYVNARAEGCLGDGVTDDTAAMQAAITKALGGVLFVPKGVYKILVNQPATRSLVANGSVTMLGEGDGSVIQHAGTATTSSNLLDCTVSGARLVVDSMKLIGSALAPADSLNTGVFHSNATTGTVVVRNSHVKGFVYQVRVWAGGTHRVEVSESRIEGIGGSRASMGVLFPGAVGATLLCRDVDFSRTGFVDDLYHQHCCYLYEAVAASFTRCRFDDVQGRYVQWYYGTGKPKFCRFVDCYFGGGIAPGVQGVVTNNQTATEFNSCTFAHPAVAVLCEGDTTFTACRVTSQAGTAYYPVIDTVTPGVRITVNGGDWGSNHQFVFRLEVPVILKVIGTDFTGLAAQHIAAYSGAAGSVIDLIGCSFNGNAPGGQAIYMGAALELHLTSCRFGGAQRAVYVPTSQGVIRALANDFSQKGQTVAGAGPATSRYIANFGETGLVDTPILSVSGVSYFSAYRSGEDIAVNGYAEANVPLTNVQAVDSYDYFDLSNGGILVKQAGVYTFEAHTTLDGGNDGDRQLQVLASGKVILRGTVQKPGLVKTGRTMRLAAGTLLTMRVYPTMNIIVKSTYSEFTGIEATRLGA